MCGPDTEFGLELEKKNDLREAYYPPIAPPIILSVNCFATRTALYANPGARERAFILRILHVHESGGDLSDVGLPKSV